MRRPITTTILMLLFVVGAFLLVQQDRFGWAQIGQPPVGSTPAATSSNAFKAGSGAGGNRYVSDYSEGEATASGGMMMGSGYGDEMGSSMMGSGYGGEYGSTMMGGSPPVPFRVRLDREAAKLRHAKTDDERGRIMSELEELLGSYFDKDLEMRQARLDDVKKRVARLESLLSKRQAAKKEIIDLQLKITVNESEGLGFFSDPDSGQSGGFGATLFDPGSGGYEAEGGGYGGGGMMEGYDYGGYGMGMDMYEGQEE